MEGTRTALAPRIRLIHWYDTQTHRLACGAPGQIDSTKYARPAGELHHRTARRRADPPPPSVRRNR